MSNAGSTRRARIVALSGALAPLAAIVVATAAACTNPDDTSASSADSAAEQRAIVLADNQEPGELNPVAGHGEDGSSRIYDGLVRLDPGDGTQIPTLAPALARELPQPNADATEWTVRLRDGVTFHDATPFDAADVVATYAAVIDPAFASPIATSFAMLERVEKVGADTVRFHLAHPYAAFPSLLLLGIAPSESLTPAAPVEESALNTEPIGTGPYRLAGLRGDELVLEAYDDYWGGAPPIERITVAIAADDNTRAQRMAAGEFDGTVLPPMLANTFADRDEFVVTANPSADWRGITLPTGHPVTADPAIRLALNYAVDRTGMIDGVLGGHGRPASTPVPGVFGDYYQPSAGFEFDRAEAERILDAAGWVEGPDGTRVNDGRRASFTLMYNAADTVRRDLARAFGSDAAQVGIEVELHGTGWDEIDRRIGVDAVVLGGGSRPYDPDTQLYSTLHSSYLEEGVGGPYDNAGDYTNDAVDAALDRGRRSTDHATRVEAYRTVQNEYVKAPAMVTLAFLDHTYVTKSGWPEPTPILEPHTHGVSWGPWWNLPDWTLQ